MISFCLSFCEKPVNLSQLISKIVCEVCFCSTYFKNRTLFSPFSDFRLPRNNDLSPGTIAGQYKASVTTADPGFALRSPFGTVTDVLAFYQQLTGTTCLTDITLSLNADGSAGIDNPASCQNAGDAGPLAEKVGTAGACFRWPYTGSRNQRFCIESHNVLLAGHWRL